MRLSQQPSTSCHRSSHGQSHCSYSTRSLAPSIAPRHLITLLTAHNHSSAFSCTNLQAPPPPSFMHYPLLSADAADSTATHAPFPIHSTSRHDHIFSLSHNHPTHTPSTTQPPTAHLQPAGCTGCAAHLPLSPYPRPTTNRQHPGMPHAPSLLSRSSLMLPSSPHSPLSSLPHLLFHPPPR